MLTRTKTLKKYNKNGYNCKSLGVTILPVYGKLQLIRNFRLDANLIQKHQLTKLDVHGLRVSTYRVHKSFRNYNKYVMQS